MVFYTLIGVAALCLFLGSFKGLAITGMAMLAYLYPLYVLGVVVVAAVLFILINKNSRSYLYELPKFLSRRG